MNNIVSESRSHPVSHKEEDENLPLKRFAKCSTCETPMTGYLVKKKGLYYYKCRVKGCKNNKSAKQLHKQFVDMVSLFQIEEHNINYIKEGINIYFESIFKEQAENNTLYKTRLTEFQKKLESVEEKYVLSEITKELYDKYTAKYQSEIKEITDVLSKTSKFSSNRKKCIDFVTKVCLKPSVWWGSEKLGQRMLMQNLMFPEGIIYDRKNDIVRTTKINSLFAPIPELVRFLKSIKKGETINFDDFSFSVTSEGFKPPTLRAEI